MKNSIKLLLTLGISLLTVNCSGKPNISKKTPIWASTPPLHKSPPQPQSNRANLPSLGRPISMPKPPIQRREPHVIEERVTRDELPKKIPAPTIEETVEQVSKDGVSYFSKKFKLPKKIKESSGLIKVDNNLWTLNDSGGKAELYQVDEKTGHIVKTLKIKNAYNRDWEDIAFDDNYVYIGDFGNNRGNRKDLKIYKIPRASLRTQKSVRAETIHFSYSDQKDFKSRLLKNNYDCEAMIAYHGKLYLFSKNWQNQKTRLYELSTTSGRHKAKYISTFNIDGMVTGATINRELNIMLLTTYSSLLNVHVWAFTNFKDNNLFGGNAKRLNFRSSLQGQVEGITFINNYKAYLSSESFSKYIFSFDATLYGLDFSREFE